MNKIIIEKLTNKDLEEAVKIYDDNHDTKTNFEKLLNNYEKIENNPDYHHIVAKIDDKVVGITSLIINHDIVEDLKPFLTIWNVSVHKAYRRQKIATTLLEYAYDYAKDKDCAFVALLAEKDNEAAQKLYESLEFNKEVGYVKFIN